MYTIFDHLIVLERRCQLCLVICYLRLTYIYLYLVDHGGGKGERCVLCLRQVCFMSGREYPFYIFRIVYLFQLSLVSDRGILFNGMVASFKISMYLIPLDFCYLYVVV